MCLSARAGPARERARACPARAHDRWAGAVAGAPARARAPESRPAGRAQAASKGGRPDARAMSNLALVHESGKWGRLRDDMAALKLYRRAGRA